MNLRKIIALLLSCAIILSVSVPSYALEPAADGTGTDETVSTETTDATEATEPTGTEGTDPTDSTQETGSSEPTEGTESSGTTDPTKATDETEATDPTDSTEETGSSEPTESTESTEATDPTENAEAGASLSDEAQSIIDWAGAISWDSQAAYDALGRYKDLSADEMAAFEQIMGYLYGLKGEYTEKYQAIYEALPAEEQVAVADAYAAYVAVEECITEFEAIAYGQQTTQYIPGYPYELEEEPTLSGTLGSVSYSMYLILNGNGGSTGSYVLFFEGSGPIPEQLTASYFPWFEYRGSIVDAEFSEGITAIPSNCFWGMSLNWVELPDSITTIGKGAFYGCQFLKTISLGSQLRKIEEPFIQNDYDLQAITVSEDNNYFCSVDGVLYSKDMTRLVRYPGSDPATEYTVPETVTSIGKNAFAGASNLTKVVLPEGLTILDDYAFASCSSLTDINWPSTLTSIGDGAFYAVPFTSVDMSGTQVNFIGDSAFKECPNLATVEFPATLKTMEDSAFMRCYSIGKIDLSMTALTEISRNCFLWSNINEVVFPSAIEKIGTSAFQGTPLSKMNLDETVVTNIASEAFSGCSKYTDPIVLPGTLTTIGEKGFYSCKGVPYFDFSGCKNFTSMGKAAFQYCEAMTSLDLSYCVNLTTISEIAFYSCQSLKSIQVPESITDIQYMAFGYCEELDDVDLSNTGITEVVDSLFVNCDALQNVEFPKKITTIGDSAFRDCRSLYHFDFEMYPYLETIERQAFGYSSLITVTLPEHIKKIGAQAFYSCHILEDVYCLFDQSTELGVGVFKYCNGNIFVRSDAVKELISGYEDLNVYVSYIITVPADIEFDEWATYEINGICAATDADPGVEVLPDEYVTMMDIYGNTAEAEVHYMGIHDFRYGKVTGEVNVQWEGDRAPRGYWKGEFSYSVTRMDNGKVLTDYTQDGTISNETTVRYQSPAGEPEYFITVPAALTVDGDAGDVTITGYSAQPVKITCGSTVEMTDTVGNKLTANVLMDPVLFPVSLFSENTVTGSVKATWDKAPMIGTWTGNFVYTVTVGDN